MRFSIRKTFGEGGPRHFKSLYSRAIWVIQVDCALYGNKVRMDFGWIFGFLAVEKSPVCLGVLNIGSWGGRIKGRDLV